MTDQNPTMDLNELAPLFGTLVVTQLDVLWTEPCCPHCCAPCAVLQTLDEAGQLDDAVRLAPEHHRDSDWWIDGRVDRTWLYSRWTCLSHPPCSPLHI